MSNKFIKPLRVKDLLDNPDNYIDKTITIGGWIQSVRTQGSKTQDKLIYFCPLSDGSSYKTLQLVFDTSKIEEPEAKESLEIFLKKLGSHVSGSFKGVIVKSPATEQPIELLVYQVFDPQFVDYDKYPLSGKKFTLEYLRQYPHLKSAVRAPQYIQRIRSQLAYEVHKFFQERDFSYLHTPLITDSDCEGGGETFQVVPSSQALKQIHQDAVETIDKDVYSKFFGQPVYLTVSGQLQGETYATQGMSAIYTFGPTFRADPSMTTRHLAEFWMIEPEVAFVKLSQMMDLAEDFVKHLLTSVISKYQDELNFLENSRQEHQEKDNQDTLSHIDKLKNIVEKDFVRIRYTEAIDIFEKDLQEHKIRILPENLSPEDTKQFYKKHQKKQTIFKTKPYWGIDLSSEHEKYLTDKVFCCPVFITHYPKKIKAFYMRQAPSEFDYQGEPTVEAYDLLVPNIGELIGGSIREERLDILQATMDKLGLTEQLDWYLDTRRFRSVPHGGFGLGFERMVMLATGTESIRDVIPYPRYLGHCKT